VKKAITLLLALPALAAAPAFAQTEADLARFEWIGGLFLQGTLASASFSFDTTPLGGILVNGEGGTLDVDPTFLYGIRASYRIASRWSLSFSWMRAQAAYRVQTPSRSRDGGNFDLEGLILGLFDFQQATTGHLASVMSDAHIDTYLASARYEIPVFGRWGFPYLSVGTGLYRQKSESNVFRSDYSSDPPAIYQPIFAAGGDPLQIIGVSQFSIDSTDLLVSVGTGLRASLSNRWGVDVGVEDMIQVGADYSGIDAASTPAPDPDNNRLFSTTFRGKKGLIHSFAIHAALDYAFWPWGRPR
jgi:Outer membrane protein beta-barrel domain